MTAKQAALLESSACAADIQMHNNCLHVLNIKVLLRTVNSPPMPALSPRHAQEPLVRYCEVAERIGTAGELVHAFA